MSGFDPLLRNETLCFQRTNRVNADGKPCMLLLPFKFVEYDGNPDRYLEPHNWSPFFHASFGAAGDTNIWNHVDPVTDGTIIARIEVFDSISELCGGMQEFHFA
jgi:hypothetical protein